MKKLVLILALILSLSANAWADDNINKQEFVNPIFYQPLRPMSIRSGYVYLTPTSIKFMTPLDKELLNATGECELIENQQDHITLLCDIFWHNPEEKGGKSIITYSIQDLFMPNCLCIEESDRALDEEYPSISSYCVTPPNYTPSETD
ncbi:MAG: hypothetical protein IJS88_05110 [Alphaproteobacteria bacterium]|nr:hypothetical protein [Alphaproteobacteria bacterium]